MGASNDLQQAARAIIGGQPVAALTGAGISVESGIPPFRGRGGLWEKYDPAEYADISSFRRNPAKVWQMQAEFLEVMERAKPNAGHMGLVELEKMGLLRTIITQNVDGLHQAAGNSDVIEFHGNNRYLVCPACDQRYPMARAREEMPPRCQCGAILKPDVVFFGEPIPKVALTRAYATAQTCRCMLVIGTSAVVEPAASIPYMAKQHGAVIIEVNPEPTGLTTSISDYFLQGPAGTVMPELVEAVRKNLP